MRTHFKILTLLIVLSCSTRDSKTFDNASFVGDQAPSSILPGQQKVDVPLLTNVVTHHFSSPSFKDTFKIRLTGRSITEATVAFEIKTNHGLVIHYATYPSYYLIGYGLDNEASEIDKAAYIRSRFLKLFDEENFRQPAIFEDEEFDADYSDAEIWEDIKSDTTAVKFEYLIGEESYNQIAYSKKLKKVVTIFSCC